ncbi:hypothetical protein JTE90_005668 [Oedothorax gibbosus]|uniref:Uncharacterized protein n=1 Tax=Oedothorax gibbosus TaxID=931172 RepID=A0AAV6UHE8_9ARAC|nr:hypothetical protein JTE90_005668 [Oedothorax gibbosus]
MKVATKTVEDLGDSIPEKCKELVMKQLKARHGRMKFNCYKCPPLSCQTITLGSFLLYRKMNPTLVFVGVVACLVSCGIVGAQAEECDEYMTAMTEGYIKNSEAIECYKDLGLDKFNYKEGEQAGEDEIKKKQEEFKSWLEEPEQKDKKGEIMECIMKVVKKTNEDLGDSVPENCKELAKANWHIEE